MCKKGGRYRDLSGKEETYSISYHDGILSIFDSSLVQAILDNEELSFSITASSSYQSVKDKYHFTTNNTGLPELYNET